MNKKKEVLDLVQRKGPISLDGLMDQIGAYSRDDVGTALKVLEAEGDAVEKEIEFQQGDVCYTREMWVADSVGEADENTN